MTRSLLVTLFLSLFAVSLRAADPTIGAIADQTILEDGTAVFSITVAGDTGADPFVVTTQGALSSLVSSVTISPASGPAGSRTVTVVPKPDANGTGITQTLRVTDKNNKTGTQSFSLNITAVNDPPSFTSGGAVSVDEDSGAYSQPWAGNVSAGPSDESGQSLTFQVTTNSAAGLFSVVPTIASDGQLSFTTAANQFGTANIVVKLTDNGGGSNESAPVSFAITVRSVNDDPVANDDNDTNTGGLLSTDQNSTLVIAATTLLANDTDVDNDTLTIQSVNMNSSNGILVNNNNGTYTYDPGNKFKNLKVGQTDNATFTYVVSDGNGGTDSATVTIAVSGLNDVPVVAGSVNPAIIPDDKDAQPFSVTISDPDDGGNSGIYSFSMEVVAGAGYGTLRPTTPFPYSGTISQIQTFAHSVVYRPIRNRVGGQATVTIDFQVTDADLGQGTNNVDLTIQGVNDLPDILGVAVEPFRTTDDPSEPPVKPFVDVLITDVDQGQQLTVSIALSNPDLGILSTNQIVGTSDLVTAAIREMTFQPVRQQNRVVGNTETLILTITALDAAGESRSDAGTRIAITAVNGSPVFVNLPSQAEQPVLHSPKTPIHPFAGVVVDDDDPSLTLTVSLDDPAKGSLTDLGGFVETVPNSRVYEFNGTVAAATVALTNLVYEVSDSYLFPPDSPGGTTFTLKAVDQVLNTTIRTLSILIQEEPRNWLVTRGEDDLEPGSLRFAIEQMQLQKENNAMITFALPEYPAVIRLTNVLSLTRNVALIGPGADLLTISGDSDGNGLPDTRLFEINATVGIEGVTLTQGMAGTGGAISVGPTGRLAIRACTISDSRATLWGGAIDVDQGAIYMDRCLVVGNVVTSGSGLGGGAVSLYTDQSCSFSNTTFSGNRQLSNNGFGGGALYVENYTVSSILEVRVTHCTFSANDDAADLGSSITANAFGSRVLLLNSIFADGRARNLEVQGAGRMLSLGGNLSDDATRTILSQGGQPDEIFLLNHETDITNAAALVMPLDLRVRPTGVHPLAASSPALGHAIASTMSVDQRGVFRDATPDSGSYEQDHFARVVINEVNIHDNPDFIELYVPRDSTPVDLTGFTVLSAGLPVHVFATNTIVQPGFGLILADTNVTLDLGTNSTAPVIAPSITNLSLANRGSVSLHGLVPGGSPVIDISYIGVFADLSDTTNDMVVSTNSLTLAPQFRGGALLPHGLVLPPPFGGIKQDAGGMPVFFGAVASPGADTANTPFGSPNAFPVSVADAYFAGEDDLMDFDVLLNDIDADGRDRLVVIGVGAISTNLSGTDPFPPSTELADLQIGDDGESVWYDPRSPDNIQRLVEGEKLTDTFYYQVVDFGTGSVDGFQSASGGAAVLLTSPAHRLTNGVSIRIAGADVPGYNGVHPVKYVDEASFTIPVTFSAAGGTNATWETVAARVPSQPSVSMVTVTVLGANDPPTPIPDVAVTDEESVIRLMGDTLLPGTSTNFTSDARFTPKPVIRSTGLLANDLDPDADDSGATLQLMGVLGEVHDISGYNGTNGVGPVVVASPGHNLSNGSRVLIANYGGHPSYNGYHLVTVIDADSFSIPVAYVDDNAARGLWVILEDGNRLAATSRLGAQVELEIRANRAETSVLYNPQPSSTLDALALGETAWDSFFYAVADRHGDIGVALVTVTVNGVNDAPIVVPDPQPLAGLVASEGIAATADLLASGIISYSRIPDRTTPSRVEAGVQLTGTGGSTSLLLTNLPATDEASPILIASDELLANDRDVDTSDNVKLAVVDSNSITSREGASVRVAGTLITYDPSGSTNLNKLARGEEMLDSFIVQISDTSGGVVESLVAVLVSGLDDSPRAKPDVLLTTANEILVYGPPNGGLLVNDEEDDINGSVPDNRLVLASVVGGRTRFEGVRYTNSNQTLTYDPLGSIDFLELGPGQFLTDGFDYVVTDGSFIFANNDQFKVTADGTGYVLNVLANDRNLTGNDQPITLTAVRTASNGGSAIIQPGGSALIYTPEVNFVGDEYFTYTIQDAEGNADRALVAVKVTVNQLNGNLQANDDQFSVARGESVILDVLANDNILPDNQQGLQITRIVSSPDMGGAVSLNGGLIRYSPSSTPPVGGYPYQETVSYEISGGGAARATAQVSVMVLDRTGTLVMRDDSYSVAAGSRDNPMEVLLNDSFQPGSNTALTVGEISTQPMHGTLSTNSASTVLIYSPDPGFVGADSFTYTARDGFGGTGSATVRIAIGSLSTDSDFFTVAYFDPASTSGAFTNELDVLANDRVLQTAGDNIRIVEVSPGQTALGKLSVKPDGLRLLFVPAIGQIGEQQFLYTITNGFGGSAVGAVTVSVREEGVKANSDYFTVLTDSASTLLPVTLNDAAIPDLGRKLSILGIGTGLNAPNHGGTVVPNSSNDGLVYTPAPGFSGEESFTYTVTDSRQSDTAKVVVRVTSGDLNANADAYTVFFETTTEGKPRAFDLAVLQNDRVLPNFGQVLRITDATFVNGTVTNSPATQGRLSVDPEGLMLTYTPGETNGPFPYVEVIHYEISDGTTARRSATATVEVRQRSKVRDSETKDDMFSVAANSVNNVLPVLLNDGVKPASAATWIITSVTPAKHQGQVVNAGTSLVYLPQPGFVGTDSFEYSVSDRQGGTGTAMVSVRVGDLPVAGDEFTALSGTQNNLFDVLGNDAIRPETANAFELLDIVQGPDLGGHARVQNGLVNYSPAALFAGTYPYIEQFSYRVVDDSGGTVTGHVRVHVHRQGADRSRASVSVTVIGVNDAPTITGTLANQTVYEHGLIRPFANVQIQDVDYQGTQPLSVAIQLSNPANGTLSALGSFVDAGAGLYRLASGAPSVATSSIRQMIFTPADSGRVQPGVPEKTQFTITVSDQVAPPVVDNTTSVTAIDAVLGKLDTTGVVAGTEYGSAVAASRDYVVVGVPKASHNGIGSGVAYVYGHVPGDFTTWIMLQKLVPDSPARSFEFGAAVAIDGDTIVIGAPTSTAGGFASGVAQVFRKDPTTDHWAFEKTLTATVSVSGDRFGQGVAVRGDTISVSSPFDDVGNQADAGSVHVFERGSDPATLWSEVRQLSAADFAGGDQFGASIDMSDDHLVVGSPLDDDDGINSGSVYVFARNNGGMNQWGFAQKITAADGVGGDQFGISVQIDLGRIAVGAWMSDARGQDSGAVYSFSLNGAAWLLEARVVSATGSSGDHFGAALGLDGSYLIVGAPGSEVSGFNAGVASVFQWATNWTPIDTFTPAPNSSFANFGRSVSVHHGTAVIGAQFDNSFGPAAGAAHIYQLRYNNAPAAAEKIPDQIAFTGQPFSYSVPVSAFSDPDVDGALKLSVAAEILPPGVVFDSANNGFTGIPIEPGRFLVEVVATDLIGETATNSFSIEVWASGGSTPGPASPGVVPLLTIGQDSNTGLFVVSFQRKPGAPYSLQTSSNLINWVAANTLVYREEIVPIDASLEVVKLYLQVFGTGSSTQFYQVLVSP